MILVTGGAGYIGSHTVVELLGVGYDLLIIDNFSNSSSQVLPRIKKIVNDYCLEGRVIELIFGDIKDVNFLRTIFDKYPIEAVMHFAGLKSVSESFDVPISYYENNVLGSVNLITVMDEFGCKKIIFSSSATVYGNSNALPINEECPLSTTNPYGYTKLVVENMLQDLANSDNEWSIAILRYFNPVGAHKSGLLGENPLGKPNNLMPLVQQVAIGKREYLNIFGDDYPTSDGTGVRDYIHVTDLALGHVKALTSLKNKNEIFILNLGTGKGYSVFEIVEAFQKVSGRAIPYKVVERRDGDVAMSYADPSLAKQKIGWKAKSDLIEMCADSWRWQTNNPDGF